MDILDHLEQVIAQRRTASPETSYVAKLNARGLPLIAVPEELEGVGGTLADLKGLKVGNTSKAGSGDVTLDKAMKMAGLTFDSVEKL